MEIEIIWATSGKAYAVKTKGKVSPKNPFDAPAYMLGLATWEEINEHSGEKYAQLPVPLKSELVTATKQVKAVLIRCSDVEAFFPIFKTPGPTWKECEEDDSLDDTLRDENEQNQRLK